LAAEWYDRELEHPKYINTQKWLALSEIAETVTQMNTVKLPQADTAILYASDTFLTFDHPKMVDPEHPQMYSAYLAVGQLGGSWFHFVSDRHIDRGQRDLADYKVLYIPIATYERRAVLDKIDRYVRDGGTVVCTDPTAFTWDINGEPLNAQWEKLSGVRRGGTRRGPATAKVIPGVLPALGRCAPVRFPGPGVRITPMDDSARVWLAFDDGAPAATLRRLGRGSVIAFASDPFATRDENRSVAALVRRMQIALGAKVDHDIWRFKLPPLKAARWKDPEKFRCLTNNHVQRDFVFERNGDVHSVHNLVTGGNYTYDRFPTGIADAAARGRTPFRRGHLTNRPAAYRQRNRGSGRNPVDLEKWIVSWTDRDPVTIAFDLKRAYPLQRLTLFYSGALPSVTVEGSLDGRQWRMLGSCRRRPVTLDTYDVTVALRGAWRYVRLRLGARTTDVPMELAEVEIWGKGRKACR
jgi:hypothetical protein